MTKHLLTALGILALGAAWSNDEWDGTWSKYHPSDTCVTVSKDDCGSDK